MKIICDTNIWYNIGLGKITPSAYLKEDDILIATISIVELAITENHLKYPEDTRRAIQSMMTYSSKSAIVDPPLHYIIKLADPSHTYDMTSVLQLLEFTKRIAKGGTIDKDKIEEYKNLCSEKKDRLATLTKFTNEKAAEIKKKIKNNEQHRNKDTKSLCKALISEIVFLYTGQYLPQDFDWSQLELFVNLFDVYLKQVEIGAKPFKENDWLDLFQCIYVQPGMKLWTKEKYWINLVKEIEMGHYLFED